MNGKCKREREKERDKEKEMDAGIKNRAAFQLDTAQF